MAIPKPQHNGRYNLTVTAINCGSAQVRVENVSEDFRNFNEDEDSLRFHGRNGALVLNRAETWAVIYERQDEEPAPVVIRYPKGLRAEATDYVLSNFDNSRLCG